MGYPRLASWVLVVWGVIGLSSAPRALASDDTFGHGDGIPDSLDPDRFSISGGRGAGCHIGGYDAGTPTNVFLLLLALTLGTRRYRRN